MKRFLFTLTLALVALVGCKKEPAPGPEPIAVTSVSLDKTEVALIIGESANVKAIVKPDDAANKEVKWTVANTSIATVDEGEVTAVAVGETTLIVTTVDGGHTATIPVKVTGKAVKEIKLVGMPTEFTVGRSFTISAVITPDDATDKSVTFTSSNPEVATVEYTESEYNYSLALLKAVGLGKATIMATANDGSGVKAEAEVTVIPSPANCYIVTEAGTYTFMAVKGNSSESVGNVASAEVLWESFGTHNTPWVGVLVKNVSYSNGEITFEATTKRGNAVIAAKDADGNILWSWHIWLTDQPQEQQYYNNAGTMMDRNLGATSATPGEVGALGLLYQWGRKDPFLGSSSISSSSIAESTITWPSKVNSNSTNGTIAYAIANPTTFIGSNGSNFDWYYTGSTSTDDTRWTTSDKAKSIYDPCPTGWRVPDGGGNGIWLKAEFDDTTYDSTNEGISFSISSPTKTWYPASGYRGGGKGSLESVGKEGHYWSASPIKGNAYGLHFNGDGDVDPSKSYARAGGKSVRCVKE